ncbi:MAG TPA: DMT family transporter [Burkholderiales bacterium]|nr:DMT family transporter [Burkholderiales bacterium]
MKPAPGATPGLYLRLVLMAACWGGQFVAGRSVAPLLPPFTAGALRIAIALAILLLLVRVLEDGLPRLDFRGIAAMAALGFTGVFLWNAFFFPALERVPAGRGALIMALNPIGTALGMVLIFHERLTRVRWFGIGLALAGAVVVISRGDLPSLFTGALGPGEVLLFGSVLSWVSYTLIGRGVLARITPLATTTWAAAFGGAVLAVAALFEQPWAAIAALPAQGWLSIGYIGVFGTVLAFLFFSEGVRRIGPSRTAIFINFVPVFGVTFAALFLGEPVLPSMILGGAMVIGGVLLTNRVPAAK